MIALECTPNALATSDVTLDAFLECVKEITEALAEGGIAQADVKLGIGVAAARTLMVCAKLLAVHPADIIAMVNAVKQSVATPGKFIQ